MLLMAAFRYFSSCNFGPKEIIYFLALSLFCVLFLLKDSRDSCITKTNKEQQMSRL